MLETLTVLGTIDCLGGRANNGHPFVGQCPGQFQRCLAAELNDDALGLFNFNNFQHVLERQRLEIQAIRGVVIGRDGLGVTVDHDGLVTILTHRQGRMNTAIIELNALANSVWPAAQDHDLVIVGWVGLALFVVARIHVRGRRIELGGTGVDPLVDRTDAHAVTLPPHFALADTQQISQSLVRESLAL